MSRRLPTSPLAGVLLLLFAGAALAPLLVPTAMAFGERVYESNTVVSGTSHLDVYTGESVAQSFLATATYRLLNLTLRLRNTGDTTDAVNVTIRTDSGGVPAAGYMAVANLVIGNTNLGNYNVPFASPASLVAGARYWIVATSSSVLLNACEWHHSAADVYPNGQAKINLNLGGGWVDPASPTDLYFVTYAQEVDANLTATIRATQGPANPGDLVTFRAYLNNTGISAALKAWLNDTLLPGLTYVSDTAASAGASTGYPSFTFSNVGNGPRSFNITAQVPIGTEPGTVLTKALTLTYVNASGVPKAAPTTQTSVFVGKQTKQLYLNPTPVGSAERLTPTKPTGDAESQRNESLKRDESAHDFDLSPVLSRAFRIYGVNATLYIDSATHDVRNLDINLTLTDWNGVTLTPVAYVQLRIKTNPFNDYQPFTFAFPGMDHTFPVGGRVRLTVRNMATSGADAVLAMNSTFASSRLDLDTTSYVRVDFLDLRDVRASATAWSPKDSLVVRANVSDPFGSSEISGARINLTAPSGSLVVNYTAMALLTTDPSSPSAWKLFQFTYAPPLQEGTYRFLVTASEANGVVDLAEAVAVVRAPRFSFVKTAGLSNVRSGDLFTYDVWFNNTGSGPAGQVWINDSLPGELTFLSSSDPGAMTGSYNWTWTSLSAGNYRLSINVQVKGGLPPIPYFRNAVFLNYTDEKGFLWPMRSATADVAFRGPAITIWKTSAKNILHTNETITYLITMQNTGDPAQTLWVNDTLPAGLSYVSDTASSLGGTSLVSGNVVYFRFSNMPGLATWSFSLTAVAAPALARGATLGNVVGLNYTNLNGFLLPPKTAAWTVNVAAPEFPSASVVIGPNQATPADVVFVTITYVNVGNEAARDVWINLTLDSDLFFLNASLAVSVTGNVVHFTLSNVGLGAGTIFLNASVNANVTDHRLLSVAGTLVYTDGFSNVLPSVPLTSDSIEASVPRILLSVTPGSTDVEAAGLVFYNIYQVNAGSGVAGDVWLSLPLPASFVYVNDTADVYASVVGSTYTWHWRNVAPGPTSFSLELSAKPSVLDNTSALLVFHTDYTDGNGNFREVVTFNATARFHAPRIELVLTSEPQEARPGDTVAYNLKIRNLGTTVARNLWLTDAIDPRFEVVTYTSSIPKTGTDVLNWSFTDLGPGQETTVTLVVRILDGTAARSLIPNVFEANYTNSGGYVIGYVRSDAVTVLVTADPTPFVYAGLLGVALAIVAAPLVLRRLRVKIEEVFLVYRDGVLIYHLSRSLSQDKDEDVLSGMLTAVQEFVRDAFAYGEHRELHQLDFGDYRILIERGKNLYLAVVYSGKGSAFVRKKVRSVLDHIETAYGRVLEKWDGDMDQVVGARDLIREYLLKPNARRLKGLRRIA